MLFEFIPQRSMKTDLEVETDQVEISGNLISLFHRRIICFLRDSPMPVQTYYAVILRASFRRIISEKIPAGIGDLRYARLPVIKLNWKKGKLLLFIVILRIAWMSC